MPFIVETPQSRPGIKLYVCQDGPRRSNLALRGARDEAKRFDTPVEAKTAILRFSGIYGLIVTEVK